MVYRPSCVQFPGTVYICNQGPLPSALSLCISCALSACNCFRRCCYCPLQCDRLRMETRLNSAGIQACDTDQDLCLSAFTQSFLLYCLFRSQEPPDTFLKRFSDDTKVIGKEVLRETQSDICVTRHNDEKQQAENHALMNTEFHFKRLTVPLTNTDMAPLVGIHLLHQSNNPLLHTKFSQRPPDDLSRYSIKCLFQIYKSHVVSCWLLDTSLAAAFLQRLHLLCFCLGQPNWESSIDTNCLMRQSTILSRTFMTCFVSFRLR